MIFMVTSLFCVLLGMWGLLGYFESWSEPARSAVASGQAATAKRTVPPRLLLGAFLSSVVLSFAIVIGFLASSSHAAPHPFGLPRPAVLLLFAGVLGSVIHTLIALKFKNSIWLLAVAAYCYLSFAAVDHLIFWGDGSKSGILATEVGRPVGVSCDAPYLLVREDADALRWRCPNNLVLGDMDEAFAPWPAYSSGNSAELKKELDKMRGSAIHSPADSIRANVEK